MKKRRLFLFLVVPPLFLLFIALGGEVVKLLWNWLLPPLFGWPEITFWQALGLLVLCRILFGRSGYHGRGRLGSGLRARIRQRISERLEHMTPEERERFRQGTRGRCDMGPSTGGSEGQ